MVEREDRLVGIITIDDMVNIIEEEATEDIQKLAGVRALRALTPQDTLKILRKKILAGLGTALALGLALGKLSLIWSPPISDG